MSLKSNLEKLRQFRQDNVRKSREVVEMWLTNLSINIEKLGRDKHTVLEQVCIAALDCYELKVAEGCIDYLSKDFPKSLRVQKLKAMYYEADENYDKALEILDDMIKQDETFSPARKRKIAILKAKGRNEEAIKELTEYLKIFMTDVEAWQELTDLYINENDFNKAAFCMEEQILINPHNHLLHQRYADIKYTQGGSDNIDLARSYYCQAIHLCPTNLRAVYGLYLTSTSKGGGAQKKKESSKLYDISMKRLKEIYSKSENVDVAQLVAALEI